MSTIDFEYDALVYAMSPKERVARSIALFQWTREMIARQIIAEMGDMPSQELKWRVALRQYGSNPQVRLMIERLLADVSS